MYSNYPPIIKPNKNEGPSDNYEGRARRKEKIQNNKNDNNTINNEILFQNTKNKVKVTLFKNGFILNDGSFRDKNIPENRKFIEQIERGIIPNEFSKKGINDLGILLENRKDEEFMCNIITTNIQNYTQGNLNINSTNINQNIYNNNIYPNTNNIPNIKYNNIKINPPIVLDKEQNFNNLYNMNNYSYQHQINDVFRNDFNNLNNKNKNQIKLENRRIPIKSEKKITKKNEKEKMDINIMSRTPIGMRGNRINIFPEKESEDPHKKLRKSIDSHKKGTKNFRTFTSWIREEKAKEEEEKKNKGQKKQETNPEEKDEKKFIPFGGVGFLIDNVNIEGLHVNKDLKKSINTQFPTCHFNIRLFNGEIITCEFNYTHTLRDIYIYVKKISGSNNFILLEGFPPKPLNQLNKTIKELKLDNTTLTQKIK